MVKLAWKIVGIGILVLMFAIPSMAQNTKGDKPAPSRESRFKKTAKKQKPARRISSNRRTTTSLRAYKPRKKSRGGEVAGRPTSPITRDRPGREGRQNVFPQSGFYVNNKSASGKTSARRSSNRDQRRVVARAPSNQSRNVYPQSGRYVNHRSSLDDRRPSRRKVTVNPRSASRAYVSRRSINMWANFSRPKQRKERAYRGDISGRRIRTKNFQSQRPSIVTVPRSTARRTKPPGKERTFYPQSGRYVGVAATQPRNIQRPVSNRTTLSRLSRMQTRKPKPGRKVTVVPRSASRSYIARKTINMWARFPRPKKKGERASVKDIAGHPLRTRNYHSPRHELIPSVPRTARRGGDAPFRAGANYKSVTRSGRPWSGDVARRRVRSNRDTDKGFLGKAKPWGFLSITRHGETRPGQRIPGKAPGIGAKGVNYSGFLRGGRKAFSNQGEEFTGNLRAGRRAQGGGSVSGRLWNNQRRAITPKAPGIGANGIARYQGNLRGRKGFERQGEDYTGNLKAHRPAKGGGSVSGRLWNNGLSPIPPRTPGIGAKGIATFRGNLRGRKSFSNQGEEYSGNIRGGRKSFSNQGEEYSGNIRGGRKAFQNQGEEYSGNIRGGRKAFQNQGEEYTGNIRRRKGFSDQGEEYSGSIRARRPVKGGGSVSGKLWNNNRTPIPVRTPSTGMMIGGIAASGRVRQRTLQDQGEEYTGNIKARRPVKGGGSVSGKLWNNNQTPIIVRAPKSEQGGEYRGNLRGGRKTFSNQGEEFTGNIKAKRPVKGGGSVSGKLWNNNETPIAVRVPKSDQGGESIGNIRVRQQRYVKNPNSADESLKKIRDKTDHLTAGLQIKVKQNRYVKNPNSADESLKKIHEKTDHLTGGLQIKIKQLPRGKNPHAAEGALAGVKPTRESIRASEFVRGMKSYKYVRNPNSSDDALKVREPGKAFAKVTNYQGNIRMKKFDIFGKHNLHPDAQFVKINKNNVDGERDMLTNFKLWWARLFKKNSTQPDNLKGREHKPRYDKGEQGLWYD